MSWRNRQQGLSLAEANKAIREKGIVLVYPIANRKEVPSLWSHFFPNSKMRWVWDETGDDRVVKIWDLRERLSRRDTVVYTKWFQGRATFFSCDLFVSLLGVLHDRNPAHPKLPHEQLQLLDILIEDSPQSSKSLKKRAKNAFGWDSKLFDRTLKKLWTSGLIVGKGEVDDGAFPSLNIGATQHLFPELWNLAQEKSLTQCKSEVAKFFPKGSAWARQLERCLQQEKPKKRKSKELRFEDLK